jgi:hypothetical protein
MFANLIALLEYGRFLWKTHDLIASCGQIAPDLRENKDNSKWQR